MRCLAAYNTEMLDRGSWLPGWNVPRNNITAEEISSYPSLDLAYIFQTETALGGKSFWGKLTTYIGGGFVATLGNTLQVKQSYNKRTVRLLHIRLLQCLTVILWLNSAPLWEFCDLDFQLARLSADFMAWYGHRSSLTVHKMCVPWNRSAN